MTSPLVATKLHVPRLRPGIVERAELVRKLRARAQSKLTLVSAPAGFGKTTLLASYFATGGDERATAWLSLDATDNEPNAFWSHFVAALQSVAGDLSEKLPPPDTGSSSSGPLLAALLNELEAQPGNIDIVLDDYHVIERQEIHEGIGFLLEHLPQNTHLIISTRSDPPLQLARLRVRGELIEVRAADLRFSPEDASAYLNGAMSLGLGKDDVSTLAQRTEGWIAALQLAALSMGGREDAADFIASFAGNDRYIVDYLVEEVLQRQPHEIRRFLKQTCVLERLSGSLCDAVTGETGGAAMLETLVRANLFVMPLDSRREWYRYHHLFADVVQAHFQDELRGERKALHQRASAWFAEHEALAEAIRHALAADDMEQAAILIERAIPVLSKSRQEPILRDWLETVPDEIVRRRPVLGIGLVGALVSVGKFADIEERLRDAESAIAAIEAGDPTAAVVDRAQLAAVPGEIELYRAALAQVAGDVSAVIKHAQRSIDLAPPDHFGRAGAHGFLGIAYWTRGELEAADQAWRESREGLRRGGRFADVMGTSIAIADINVTLGRLREAARVWEDALQVSAGQRHVPRGTADLHAGLAELNWASGDMETASQHLTRGQELGELAGLPQFPHRWRVAMAKLRQVSGDPEGALELLDEAERLYVPDFFPNVRPIAAMKARVLIRQGRLVEAERWQRESGVGVDDELTYLREFDHITLARLLLARDKGDVLPMLARLRDAAEAASRFGSVIEISVLQALAHRAGGDNAAATAALERALKLAAPEGFVQVFLDEGAPMVAMLKAVKRGDAYARLLLAAAGDDEEVRAVSPVAGDLTEPLSDRELDVLRLLRSDLDGPDIARELRVSLNTMRTHTKNIYEKLGVNNRRAAVRRAEELELVQRR